MFLESLENVLEVLPFFYYNRLQLLLVLNYFLLLFLFVLLFFRQSLWQRYDQLLILRFLVNHLLWSSHIAMIQLLLGYHLRTLLILFFFKFSHTVHQ